MEAIQMELPEEFDIEVDGEKMPARRGQTIAAAILASGRRTFRKTRHHAPRGPYCGIGLCYECRMRVAGVPNVRTCVTFAEPGCRVETQDDSLLERLKR